MNPLIVKHDGSPGMVEALSIALARARLNEHEVHVRPGNEMSDKSVAILGAMGDLSLAESLKAPTPTEVTIKAMDYDVPFIDYPKVRGKRRGVRAGGAFGRCRNRP